MLLVQNIFCAVSTPQVLLIENYALQKPNNFSVKLKELYPEHDGISPNKTYDVLYIMRLMAPDRHNQRTIQGMDGRYYAPEFSAREYTFIVVRNTENDLVLIHWDWLHQKSLYKHFLEESPFITAKKELEDLVPKTRMTSFPPEYPELGGYVVLKLKEPLVTAVREDYGNKEFRGSKQTIEYVFVPLGRGVGPETYDINTVSMNSRGQFAKDFPGPIFQEIDFLGPQYIYISAGQSPKRFMDRRWLAKLDIQDHFRFAPVPELNDLLITFIKSSPDKLDYPKDWIDRLCKENKDLCTRARFKFTAQEKQALLSQCTREGYPVQYKCESYMREGWLACSKDSDCVAVPDECGYWTPVNANHKDKHMRSFANSGGPSCRFASFSGKNRAMPVFKCVNKVCASKP